MNKILVYVFGVMSITITACQKNIDVYFNPNSFAGPDTTWVPFITADLPVNQLRNNLMSPAIQDTISLLPGVALQYTNTVGLELNAPGNIFRTATGLVPANPLIINTKMLRTRGQIIMDGFPTVTNNQHLVSGGEVLVSIHKDSAELVVAQGQKFTVNIPANSTTGDLKLYNLQGNFPLPPNWILNTDTTNNKVSRTGTGLVITSNKLGWLNAAQMLANTTTPMVQLSPVLPRNYTNANTFVFVSFNEQITVSLMNPVISGKYFQSLPIPAGTVVKVIVISKQVDDFYFDVQAATAIQGINSGLQQVNMSPLKTNFSVIKQYLQTL